MEISRFHYLTQDLDSLSHKELARGALMGGATWVQLRAKEKELDEWARIAEEVRETCKQFKATLIINDSLEVALRVGAQGIHLGKNDETPNEARRILGPSAIIGGSANTTDDIKRLLDMDVDYIGLGPFKDTQTKKDLNPVLGLEGIQRVLDEIEKYRAKIPIIAIGGITARDLHFLFELGIHGVAVSSAINFASDRTKATKEFLEYFRSNEYER